jgi:phage terminase large subunit-like protein
MSLLLSPFELAADQLDPQFSLEEISQGMQSWRSVRRPSQCAPTTPADWYLWFILAGRGWGKTRTGAEWLLDEMSAFPYYRYAVIGANTDETRDTMVEGESGLLACAENRKMRVDWNRSLGHFKIRGGARADTYTAEKPDGVRGPNVRSAWCDEPASWRFGQETWDTLQFMMRKGDPRICVTGTPKATPFIKFLIAQADVITKGRSKDNEANLSKKYYSRVILPYIGTRLGRQELDAEILEDVDGALLKQSVIDANRVTSVPMHQEIENNAYVDVADLIALLVSIDPSVSDNPARNALTGKRQRESDEAGIIVAALGEDNHGYLLDDRSGRMKGEKWAGLALDLYDQYEADRIIAEVNNGGDLVEVTLRSVTTARGLQMPRFKQITASRGKDVRAEPVAGLHEQGLIHYVGNFPKLEDEWTSWIPKQKGQASPNRMDAEVYAFSELLLRKQGRQLGYSIR